MTMMMMILIMIMIIRMIAILLLVLLLVPAFHVPASSFRFLASSFWLRLLASAPVRSLDEVNAIKSPTCQPPSRIRIGKYNICSDGWLNQTERGWRHHLLCISGFGDVAGARVIIAGQCEGRTHASLSCQS